jgi:hypothetical protein
MASGITATDECVSIYETLKLNQSLSIYGGYVDTKTKGPIYNTKTTDGIQVNRIFFVSWIPEGMKVKPKMTYASAREPFKQQLGNGLSYVIQATNYDDINEEGIGKIVGVKKFKFEINIKEYFTENDGGYFVFDSKQMIIYRIKDEKIVVDQIITSL